ncbi:hypothetical protein CHUAL_009094 [Chamberlinius hualienensis]
MGSQQFCLRWNNHQMNMLNVFDQLLHNGDFVDVTLSCSGGNIKAHKMVLSACSPYFQELFRENPCKHPIVILKDMKMVELRSIVEFMYKGEINVSQDQLPTLLKTAESLKVKGLAEVSSGGSKAVAGDQTTSNSSSSRDEGSAQPTINGNNGGGGTSRFTGDGNSQSDDRMSPPTKRKRHRPRRHSNDESNNDEMEDKNDISKDVSKSSLLKSEPLEVNEPQIELLMDDEQFPRLDATMNEQERATNDSRDGNSRLSQSDMIDMSQPSTSGAHGSTGAVWSRSSRNKRFGSCINAGISDIFYRNDNVACKSSNMMKKIKEHRQMIRKAMHTVFTHQEMATHSLTGRKAFGNDPLPALDPNKVSLVFDYLHRQLPQFGGSIIKQAMAQVLVCERRLYDRRATLPIYQRGKTSKDENSFT